MLASSRVVAILDRIVGAAGQSLHDLAPLVTELQHALRDKVILLLCPRDLGDIWTQLVEPPLAALFAGAAGDLGSDERPA
eukprot:1625764-Prymnesium_polylepis.1